MMTPEEFAKEVNDLYDNLGWNRYYALQVNHEMVDEMMCKILTELGYGEGVERFKREEKWYS